VSKTAFDALGFSVGNPSSGESWKVVPCSVSGNVKVRVKSGNSNQVYVENERLPIQSVTQNGAAATRLSHGAWQLLARSACSELEPEPETPNPILIPDSRFSGTRASTCPPPARKAQYVYVG